MKKIAYEGYKGLNLVAAAAANTPKLNNKFIVFTEEASDGEVIVITAFAPWAKTTISPGDGAEEVQYISPGNGDGFFFYEPVIGNGAAKWNTSADLPAWQNQAASSLGDPKTSSGITAITDKPRDVIAMERGKYPLIIIPPGQKLLVLWSLVADAVTTPLDKRYSIGGAVTGTKSVTYAGVAMAGQRMSQALFEEHLKKGEW